MSADRELLELAAKAAGMTLGSGRGEWTWWDAMHCFNAQGERGESRMWNPLTDDGDALRLAVKLVIDIRPPRSEDDDALAAGQDERGFFESQKRDPYAATRRAIVRAAAAIGSQQ